MDFNFDGKDLLTKGKSPGWAVAVARNQKLLYSYTHGYADVENSIYVTDQTNFRLASVTKQFMSVGILILIQKGLLSFNDPLIKFFPDFPRYGKQITIFHLLTHSSGLKNYEDLIPREQKEHIGDKYVLELLKNQTATLFWPGSKYDYNNGGYCLLRLIMEIVSQQPIDVFLRKELFYPLKMDKTEVNFEGETNIRNRAYGYSKRHNSIAKTDQNLTSSTVGDGGIYSSIEDLSKWDKVFYTDILLSKELRSMIFQKHILTDEGRNIYYGFGLFLKEDGENNIAFHGGSSIGFETGVYYILNKQLTIIYLSNSTGKSGVLKCRRIANSILRKPTNVTCQLNKST